MLDEKEWKQLLENTPCYTLCIHPSVTKEKYFDQTAEDER